MFAIHPASFLDFGSCTQLFLVFSLLQFLFLALHLLVVSPILFASHQSIAAPLHSFSSPRSGPKRAAAMRAYNTHQTKDIHTEWKIYIRYGEGIHTSGNTHSWDIHTDGTTYGWDYTRMELYVDGTIHGWVSQLTPT